MTRSVNRNFVRVRAVVIGMTTAIRHMPVAFVLALMTTVAGALLLGAMGSGRGAGALVAVTALPDAHFDPAEGMPLDLYGARFGQTADKNLTLVLRTHQPWEPADVQPTPTTGLCVFVRSDAAKTPGGRLCVVPEKRAKSGVALRYSTLDANGMRLGIRNLTTEVRRPGPTTIRADFAPSQLRLVPGRYHWQVRSMFAKSEDRLPNRGELALEITVSTAPAARERCFGAASRDPYRRCRNRGLRTAVVPAPEEAVFQQNSPCTPLPTEGELGPCEFGVPADHARGTIALLGDSHASHWRAALEVVAQRKRWRGVSITRSGCPVMRATTKLQPVSRRASCLNWNRQLPGWLSRHPKIETVFVVQHFAGDVRIPNGRTTERETKIAGFIKAWKALPKSVKHIIVIRDTPLIGHSTLECVRRAKEKGRDAGTACSVSRERALRSDPAVTAAARIEDRRVEVIDMTRFLCSAKRCYPVIGGALVYKDDQHLTEVFGSTLGPYLGGAIDRVL
jgi:hypothetical protein